MQPLVELNQVVLEFWTRKAYNPAPHPEVRSFFFTQQEEQDFPDAVLLLDHFLELLKRDGYISYSSHEYTWPDGSPMKLFQLTPMGVELGKQLAAV